MERSVSVQNLLTTPHGDRSGGPLIRNWGPLWQRVFPPVGIHQLLLVLFLLLFWASVSSCDSKATYWPCGLLRPVSRQVFWIRGPFALLISRFLPWVRPSPASFLPVSFYCRDSGVGGEPPGLEVGRGRQLDIMKWASELTLPKLGERYPPVAEPGSRNGGVCWLFRPGS